MEIQKEERQSTSITFSISKHGSEIARASLFLITNDLHNKQYGLIEDVYVEPEFRGQGLATQLIQEVMKEAKRKECYKIIATSRHARPQVHEMYQKFGFHDYGKEFRINLE